MASLQLEKNKVVWKAASEHDTIQNRILKVLYDGPCMRTLRLESHG